MPRLRLVPRLRRHHVVGELDVAAHDALRASLRHPGRVWAACVQYGSLRATNCAHRRVGARRVGAPPTPSSASGRSRGARRRGGGRSLPRISSSSSTAFVSDSEFLSGIFFIANLVPPVRSSTLKTSLVTPAPSLRPTRYALITSSLTTESTPLVLALQDRRVRLDAQQERRALGELGHADVVAITDDEDDQHDDETSPRAGGMKPVGSQAVGKGGPMSAPVGCADDDGRAAAVPVAEAIARTRSVAARGAQTRLLWPQKLDARRRLIPAALQPLAATSRRWRRPTPRRRPAPSRRSRRRSRTTPTRREVVDPQAERDGGADAGGGDRGGGEGDGEGRVGQRDCGAHQKEMDKKFQSLSRGAWHCIVGGAARSYVTHEASTSSTSTCRGAAARRRRPRAARAPGASEMVARRRARRARRAPGFSRAARLAHAETARALRDVSLTRTRAARADVLVTACCSWRALFRTWRVKMLLEFSIAYILTRDAHAASRRRLPAPRPTLERKHTIQRGGYAGRGPRSVCLRGARLWVARVWRGGGSRCRQRRRKSRVRRGGSVAGAARRPVWAHGI